MIAALRLGVISFPKFSISIQVLNIGGYIDLPRFITARVIVLPIGVEW